MSRIAELLGGEDDQCFRVDRDKGLYRFHDGKLQIMPRDHNGWIDSYYSCDYIISLLDGEKKIEWLRPHTDKERLVAQAIRTIIPNSDFITISNYEIKRTESGEIIAASLEVEVFDDNGISVMNFDDCCGTFSDVYVGDDVTLSIDEILG